MILYKNILVYSNHYLISSNYCCYLNLINDFVHVGNGQQRRFKCGIVNWNILILCWKTISVITRLGINATLLLLARILNSSPAMYWNTKSSTQYHPYDYPPIQSSSTDDHIYCYLISSLFLLRIRYTLNYIKKAPNNQSPWTYLKG